MAQAPDELTGIAAYWSAPMSDELPEEIRGAPVVVVAACWSGALAEGEQAIQPLRAIGTPLLDFSGAMPYLAAQKLFDPDYPRGDRYYWKSILLTLIGDELLNLLGDLAARRPSSRNLVAIWALGGAIARVKPGDTAFFQRDVPWLLSIEGNAADPAADEANFAWVREVYRKMQQFSSSGAYLNFPGFHEEGDELLRQTFGANYERLREIRAKYDPDGLFQFNVRL
ncbi:MAG: FAD-dependent oxidoreductase [Chloroflexi bacterium]|nr:MAG: FAD-dependent oxidoreductase [Chloroflexota bacterium]